MFRIPDRRAVLLFLSQVAAGNRIGRVTFVTLALEAYHSSADVCGSVCAPLALQLAACFSTFSLQRLVLDGTGCNLSFPAATSADLLPFVQPKNNK